MKEIEDGRRHRFLNFLGFSRRSRVLLFLLSGVSAFGLFFAFCYFFFFFTSCSSFLASRFCSHKTGIPTTSRGGKKERRISLISLSSPPLPWPRRTTTQTSTPPRSGGLYITRENFWVSARGSITTITTYTYFSHLFPRLGLDGNTPHASEKGASFRRSSHQEGRVLQVGGGTTTGDNKEREEGVCGKGLTKRDDDYLSLSPGQAKGMTDDSNMFSAPVPHHPPWLSHFSMHIPLSEQEACYTKT